MNGKETPMDNAWKKRERQLAAFFGTYRNRLSGSSGRDCDSRSDSIHETLYLELKHGDLARFLNAEMREALKVGRRNAKAEGKRLVMAMSEKNHKGFWLLVHTDDFLFAAKEAMARTET